MRGVLQRVSPALVVALLVVTGCSPRDLVPKRLQARLKSVLEPDRPDLTRDEVQQALTRQLRVAPVPAKGSRSQPKPVFPTRETLAQFYAHNGHRLVWCDESGELRESTATLLNALRSAGEHGLDPEQYAFSRLEQLKEKIVKATLDDAAAARLADFDLLMTAAFLRYASDLTTGRVHPDEIRNDWHTNPPELDPAAKLDLALKEGKLEELIATLPPPHEGYARLREALKKLREVDAGGGWPQVPTGPPLAPGARGPRVAALRQRLSGSPVPADAAAYASTGAGDQYDAALADSVRRFQSLHGIEPDGKVDARTLGELNSPVDQRIRQVELNLERWRWIPRRLGDPCVILNIPAFELQYRKGGATVLRMRIVVGQAFTPTPVFSDQIVAVVANPPWNVPESISLKEYLPELRENPKAFAKRGLRIMEGPEENAREIDPAKVNWRRVDEEDFPYHIRQDPGPDNALGRVKFHLTNDFHIYLHDTPARSLFGHSDRDLSHGCIRVEKPLELAARILDEPARELLREALETTEERHLPVKPPVPIHLVYLTAWVDEAGALHFSPDVYDHDGPQRTALDRAASRLSGGSGSGGKDAVSAPAR